MPSPPTIVGGRYRLGALIAATGMAEVYTATDERLDRPVALKFLRAAGPTDESRFRLEMATLARLEHPNLVRLYDADVQDATPYLVLELVDGPSLAQLLSANGPLDVGDASRLLVDLASALEYIHARDVVHRDVKPANVLVEPDGRARLTDFGIARVGDATALTGTAMTIGTAAYLAPEQARGDHVASAADIYALGLVLLECLTGERAFPGPPMESAVARLTRDPEIPVTLDADWRALLAAMTSRDPHARPIAASITRWRTTAASVPIGTAVTAPIVAGDDTVDGGATVPMGTVERDGTVPMGTVDAASTVGMDAGGVGATEVLPAAIDTDTPRRRTPRALPLVAGVVVLALLALGLSGALGSGDPGNTPVRSSVTTTTVPPTTVAPTTVPPATVPPATVAPTTTPASAAPPPRAAPAVASTVNCTSLQAERKALDDQKQQPGGGKDADKAARDALDARKKELDAALKACHG